jgi:metal-responsive CopG/Arc/MetJ family transcriptional regulator
MKDIVLSIRLPPTLVQELKELAQKNHYLDLSEQIRTIIRQKCEQYTEPYKHEVQKMREQLEQNISESKENKDKEKLLEELQKIILELKK